MELQDITKKIIKRNSTACLIKKLATFEKTKLFPAWPGFIGSSYDSRTSDCATIHSSQEEFDEQRCVRGRGARRDAV